MAELLPTMQMEEESLNDEDIIWDEKPNFNFSSSVVTSEPIVSGGEDIKNEDITWDENTSFDYPFEEKQEDTGFYKFYGKQIESASERHNAVKEMIKRRSPSGEKSKIEAVSEITEELPFTTALAASQYAGIASDFIWKTYGEAAKHTAKTLAPKWAEDWAKEEADAFLSSPTVHKAIEYGSEALDFVGNVYEKIQKQAPNLLTSREDAEMALNGALNYWSLYAAGATTKETYRAIGDVKRLSARAFQARTDYLIQNEVKSSVSKAIKPLLSTYSPEHRDAWYESAKNAFIDIIKNKGKIKFKDGDNIISRLPRTVDEASRALMQRKRQIFQQYDAMKKAAKGYVETKPIQRLLEVFSKNKIVNTNQLKDVREHALGWIEDLNNMGPLTATEAQNFIQVLNSQAMVFNKNPSRVEYGKAMVDKIVATHLRKKLGQLIKSEVGEGYMPLRKAYADIKKIEESFNRATNRIMNAPELGITDMGTNVFTSYQAVNAIANFDASMMAAAGTAKGTQVWMDLLRNPDRKIRKAFQKAEELYNQSQAFVPKSMLFKSATSAYDGIKKTINDMSKAKVLNPDDYPELTNIVNQVKRELPQDIETPTFERKGKRLDFTLPESAKKPKYGEPSFNVKPAEKSAEESGLFIEEVINIAQSHKGKQLLIERLSQEEKYSKLVDSIKRIPTTKALPTGGDFVLLSEEEIAQREAIKAISKNLGEKKIKSTQTGGLTQTETINRAGRQRGYIDSGVVNKLNR